MVRWALHDKASHMASTHDQGMLKPFTATSTGRFALRTWKAPRRELVERAEHCLGGP
jgi:hypothetical protein